MKNKIQSIIAITGILLCTHTYAQTFTWHQLIHAPYNSMKQDGIYFINADTGWCVHGFNTTGNGSIYRTHDGGNSWTTVLSQSSTYFRCISFINDTIGFAGNIAGYYPGVTDTIPLYKTIDGGNTWQPVYYTGAKMHGICAIDYVATPFIYAGHLDTNYTIYAGGRVNGPTAMLKSTDNGNTWTAIDLSGYISMVTDIKFISQDTGFIFGSNSSNTSYMNAEVLYTTDGGNTFTVVYQSSRAGEMIWKGCFVNSKVGYGAILSFTNATQRYVTKTTDGGQTWTDLPLVNNGDQEFGIDFITDSIGWVGGSSFGYQTVDGGNTWTTINLGEYANKFSIIKEHDSITAYAIGLNVFKLKVKNTFSTGIAETLKPKYNLLMYPNPTGSGIITIETPNINLKDASIEITDINGRMIDSKLITTMNDKISVATSSLSSGVYLVSIKDSGNIVSQKFIVGGVKP